MPKGELVVCGKFEWWSEKDEINIDKHKDANNIGISFRDILPVFDDPFLVGHSGFWHIKKHHYSFKEVEKIFNDPYFYEIYDIHHSEKNQDRYNGLGYVEKTGLSVVQVVYTETGRTHIISARPATSWERKMYYERLRKIYSEM